MQKTKQPCDKSCLRAALQSERRTNGQINRTGPTIYKIFLLHYYQNLSLRALY